MGSFQLRDLVTNRQIQNYAAHTNESAEAANEQEDWNELWKLFPPSLEMPLAPEWKWQDSKRNRLWNASGERSARKVKDFKTLRDKATPKELTDAT